MAILVPANVGADDALHPPIGQLVAQLVPHLHSPLPPILVLRRRARTIALVAGLEDGRIKPASRHFQERWVHLGPVFLVIPLTKSLETCFAMAEERGLFAGDAKSRTVNDIVEDIKMTKKQMADLKAMEEDSIFSDDSNEEDSDGDSDGEGMNTYELAIASLKKRLKELKSELKNHSK